MTIERSAWRAWLAAAASAAIACGCSGALDGSSSVITDDGEPHAIADVYGASSDASAGLVGEWTLIKLDAYNGVTETRLHFLADGHLDMIPSETIGGSDETQGDTAPPSAPFLYGPRVSCDIAGRWRMIDMDRLGILLTCSDRLNREAVFGFPGSIPSFPPNGSNDGRQFELTLDTVGREPASTPNLRGPWALYKFGLLGGIH